jgi:hypothetical protein
MNLRWQTIKISSVLSPRYSAKWRSPLMPMLGFAPLNPSLLFLRFHVRTLVRLTSLPSNYAELPRIWWDNYCAMQADGHVISWEEFRNAFRAHHIPEGLMERKLNEFLALTQGTRTVLQYA